MLSFLHCLLLVCTLEVMIVQKKNMINKIEFDKKGYNAERDTYCSVYYAKQAFKKNEHNKGCNSYEIERRPILRKTETGEVLILGETIETGYEKVINLE